MWLTEFRTCVAEMISKDLSIFRVLLLLLMQNHEWFILVLSNLSLFCEGLGTGGGGRGPVPARLLSRTRHIRRVDTASAGSADAVLLSCWDSGALFVSLSARLSSNRCLVYLGNPFVHWKAFLHSPNNQTPLYPFIFVFIKEIVLK